MRLRPYSSLFLLMALSFLPYQAMATGVLLPEETTTQTTNDSVLGLIPKEAPKKKVDENLMNMIPSGTVEKQPATFQDRVIAASIAKGKIRQSKPMPYDHLVERVHNYEAEWDKQFERDSTIIDELDMPKINDPEATSFITITPAANYVWGLRDADIAKRFFGYEAADLASKCQIRFQATVETDKDKYIYNDSIFPKEQKKINYAGNMITITFIPYAVCVPPTTLPKTNGILMRRGNLLSTQMMTNASCTPPNNLKNPRYLAVIYNGDGRMTCKFN